MEAYLGLLCHFLNMIVSTWYLDLRAITHCVVVRSGDIRQFCCLLQQLAFSESRHFDWDIFPSNTMAYDEKYTTHNNLQSS